MEGRRVSRRKPRRNPLYTLFMGLLALSLVLFITVIVLSFKLKGARDEKSAEMLDLIFDNLYVDNNAIYDFGGSMSCLSNSVFNGTEFSSAYASREEKIAADIEKLRAISDD